MADIQSNNFIYSQYPTGAVCGNQFPLYAFNGTYGIGSNNPPWNQMPVRAICGWQIPRYGMLIGGTVTPPVPVTTTDTGGTTDDYFKQIKFVPKVYQKTDQGNRVANDDEDIMLIANTMINIIYDFYY